jgi:hypothetical protein
VTPLTDLKDLASHDLKDVKSRRIILDVMKYHLIPHMSEKKLAKDMFVALSNVFQKRNTNRIMVLRDNIKDTKMTKLDTVTNYLTNITPVCDQLAVFVEVVSNDKLVRTSQNCFSKPWAPLIKGIVPRDKLPYFDKK